MCESYVPVQQCELVYRCVHVWACCSCAGPDRWIRVWHQWMKWPPFVLPGSWPKGSSVLALPPRTQQGGEKPYTTRMHYEANKHTYPQHVLPVKHPSITSPDSSGATEHLYHLSCFQKINSKSDHPNVFLMMCKKLIILGFVWNKIALEIKDCSLVISSLTHWCSVVMGQTSNIFKLNSFWSHVKNNIRFWEILFVDK